MKSVVSKIDEVLDNFNAVTDVNKEKEALDVHDDIRIHVYYDEDGWVWDAIEGEYIIAVSEEAFDSIEKAEEDAKAYIENSKIQDAVPEIQDAGM